MSAYDGNDGTDDFDGYDPYAEEDDEPQAAGRRGRMPRRGGGATPLGAGVAGLLIGALLMGIVLSAVGGNPFSDANDVVYRDIVVSDISVDRICWSTDPGRRDAQLDCAILSIDPTAAVPEEGERVTVGVVNLRTPDGVRATQVVYLRGAAPSDSGDSDDVDPDAADSADVEADAEATDDAATDSG